MDVSLIYSFSTLSYNELTFNTFGAVLWVLGGFNAKIGKEKHIKEFSLLIYTCSNGERLCDFANTILYEEKSIKKQRTEYCQTLINVNQVHQKNVCIQRLEPKANALRKK